MLKIIQCFGMISVANFILKKETVVLIEICDNFQRVTCLIPDS
jgi:hypothetical protein